MVPGVEAWEAWDPGTMAGRLRDVTVPWCVAAGWAVELFLEACERNQMNCLEACERNQMNCLEACERSHGHRREGQYRAHDDLEIAVPAGGFTEIAGRLSDCD